MRNIEEIRKLVKESNQKGFFHLFSANVLIQLFAFTSQLLVAWFLLPEDIGRIKIIQTYLTIFLIVGSLGFNVSALKYCSEKNSFKRKISFFQTSLIFTVLSSIICFIIVLILNYFNMLTKDESIKYLIPFGLFPVITSSLFMVFVAYSQATKQIKLMSKLTVFNKLTAIIGIIILTFYFEIKGYFLAYNLSFVIMLTVCFIVYYKTIFHHTTYNFKKIKKYFFKHWSYARPSMFANLFAQISANLDILLINFFIYDKISIGYYSFALIIIVVLRLFPSTVQQISIPYFSSLAKERDAFLSIFNKYNRLLFFVVGASLVVALICFPFLIKIVFNGKYDLSIVYLIPLLVGWSIRQLTQLQSAAIFGLGKVKYNMYTNAVSIAVNIIIYPIALYFFGLTGIACASIITNGFYYLTSLYFFKKAKKELLTTLCQ
jgi:O-antigen/teichoic acid export membrane protein